MLGNSEMGRVDLLLRNWQLRVEALLDDVPKWLEIFDIEVPETASEQLSVVPTGLFVSRISSQVN
jgi:hypothetical protein